MQLSEFLKSEANLFHSIMANGKKGIFEKIMMNFEEWNISSVSSNV